MKEKKYVLFAWILAGMLLFFAGFADAEEPEQNYSQLMEQAQKDRQAEKYRESAIGAARAFFLADQSETRLKAAELSASSSADAKKAGDEIRGTVSIVIDPAAGKLYLAEGETIRKIFDVICNSEFVLPAGKYIAGPKLSYPNYELNGNFHKAMTEENPLGARWIEIQNEEGAGISGIHGRIEGTKEHLLFFSLQNKDMIELFGLLAEGGRIDIK